MKLSRYYSVSQDGSEMYTENIPSTGEISDYLNKALKRLKSIRKVFPESKWSMKIEEQYREKNKTHYRSIDVETKEIKEGSIDW